MSLPAFEVNKSCIWKTTHYIISLIKIQKGFPGAKLVKKLPVMQEMCVWSQGQEDPLKKEMATHSSILAGEISWTEKPSGL